MSTSSWFLRMARFRKPRTIKPAELHGWPLRPPWLSRHSTRTRSCGTTASRNWAERPQPRSPQHPPHNSLLLSPASPAGARPQSRPCEHPAEYSAILNPVRGTLPVLMLIFVAATLSFTATFSSTATSYSAVKSSSAPQQAPAAPQAPAPAPTAPQTPSPLSVVVLDPAHGGSDSGARGPS